MKIPKLKYYYFAMSPQEYQDFETNRSILVHDQAIIDITTGKIVNRSRLLLCGSVPTADTQFRLNTGSGGSVYVLRIPGDSVDRSQLVSVGPNAWHYGRSITVPHCGVERIDIDNAVA